MKKNYFFRLALLLFAVTLGQSVKAQDTPVIEDVVIAPLDLTSFVDDGDECKLPAYAIDSYEISSAREWNALAYYVAAGNNCAGLTFKMTRDIPNEEDDVMAVEIPLGKQTGTTHATRMRFAGTFLGGESKDDMHTLTIYITDDDNPWYANNPRYCAPFAYAQNATIKYLHVTGEIVAHSQFAAGLVGQTGPDNDTGNGKCTIESCHVSVDFIGLTNPSDYGNHGTFISVAEGNTSITDCWFDGTISGDNYYYSGGFIGQNKATATLTDCLFNPAENIVITNNNIFGSNEFSRNLGAATSSLTRCYYTRSFSDPEDAQGEKVRAIIPGSQDDYNLYTWKAPDGEDYYIVQENYVWGRIQRYLNGTANETDMEKLGTIVNAGTITLPNDLIAGRDNGPLDVPSQGNFIIDLNNYTLDRALFEVTNTVPENGYVITNNGTLTIKNGTVKGGHILTGNGAGICNNGILTLQNVEVTDNMIGKNGGNGAGIFNATNASLSISGAVKVTSNRKNKAENNLYLANSNAKITISGSIEGSEISLYKSGNTGVFTSGLSSNGNASNFISDKGDYYVALVEEGDNAGEAKLSTPVALTIGDGQTNVITDGTLANVTLTRTFAADTWYTICLPFDVNSSAVKHANAFGTKAVVRELTGASVDDGKLSLTFAEPFDKLNTSLKAGKSYLVKPSVAKDGTEGNCVTFSKVTINQAPIDETLVDGIIAFKGTYKGTTLTENLNRILYMSNNKLYYTKQPSITFKPFRAYFELDAAYTLYDDDGGEIKGYEINLDDGEDDATGIFEILANSVEQSSTTGWYSIDGSKLSGKPAHKGLYIVNGKKVVIK